MNILVLIFQQIVALGGRHWPSKEGGDCTSPRDCLEGPDEVAAQDTPPDKPRNKMTFRGHNSSFSSAIGGTDSEFTVGHHSESAGLNQGDTAQAGVQADVE